uniref:Uncharacterized protein n=1 Tax=Arundo donax TaxID=35708 RepID=A0A0A8YTL5_ARUDO
MSFQTKITVLFKYSF